MCCFFSFLYSLQVNIPQIINLGKRGRHAFQWCRCSSNLLLETVTRDFVKGFHLAAIILIKCFLMNKFLHFLFVIDIVLCKNHKELFPKRHNQNIQVTFINITWPFLYVLFHSLHYFCFYSKTVSFILIKLLILLSFRHKQNLKG